VNDTDTESADRVAAVARAVLRDITADPGLDPRRESSLREDLGLDSADTAELLVELEARLGRELPDGLFAPTAAGDPLATVGALVDTVAAHLGPVHRAAR
jgi:acyl carrier protein